jgi:hypothetical protein
MDVFGESTWMYSRRVCVDRYMLFKLPGELLFFKYFLRIIATLGWVPAFAGMTMFGYNF